MAGFIFLDFDGVLNTNQYQAELAISGEQSSDMYGPLFDPHAVRQLRRLIERTEAKIIVTSSWRFIHSIGKIKELWKYSELPGEVHKVIQTENEFSDRGIDILSCDIDGAQFVIIDDENDYPPELQWHLIQTSPIKGLSFRDVEKAISILNNKSYEQENLS